MNYSGKSYYVYFLTNKNKTVIYTGVTSNIIRRLFEHKTKYYKGFTSRYNCDRLVYYEEYIDFQIAIAREKQLKAGNRRKKEELINSFNPNWDDLSENWIFYFS